MKFAGAAALILLGIAWPFATYWAAMTGFPRPLLHDPRLFVLYGLFVSVLPTPALLYAGCIVAVRDELPFPTSAIVAVAATTVLMAAITAAHYVVVGRIGFTAAL